jgi:hypothetical protein
MARLDAHQAGPYHFAAAVPPAYAARKTRSYFRLADAEAVRRYAQIGALAQEDTAAVAQEQEDAPLDEADELAKARAAFITATGRDEHPPDPDRAAFLAALGNREPVATVYRRLGWTRRRFEAFISAHYDDLVGAGMRLHVATKDVASGRQEQDITVDSRRYSWISIGHPER